MHCFRRRYVDRLRGLGVFATEDLMNSIISSVSPPVAATAPGMCSMQSRRETRALRGRTALVVVAAGGDGA